MCANASATSALFGAKLFSCFAVRKASPSAKRHAACNLSAGGKKREGWVGKSVSMVRVGVVMWMHLVSSNPEKENKRVSGKAAGSEWL